MVMPAVLGSILILSMIETSKAETSSFMQCQYGYAFSQPESQCPGFRIRFMDSASRQCYLSFGEQCTTCAGARTYVYESEDELNMFWDCESKGAKWKLSGANKDSLVALHSQYTAQANSIVSATNEHDLKGDLVVSGANDWTSFNFGEASKIRMSANTGCGVTAASELVEFAANARYTHGYNFTQGYEARVSCVSSVLLQMPSVEFVYEGIPEPTPGVLTEVDVTELPGAQTGNGSLRLQEALTYMHPGHTLECSIQLANLTNGSVEVDVLPGSYVVISNEMYEASIHIELGGILLASTNVLESELPRDCLKHPAFKIVGIEMLNGGVKLEVQEAAFFEYITEFEGTFANLPFLEEVYAEEPEEEIVNEQEMIDQEIENATITLYEYYCVDYDEDGFEIPNSTFIPADGLCNDFTVGDEEAGRFGDNGFLPTERRRRTWGWFKRLWKKVVKAVVTVVKAIVKVVVKVVKAIVTFVEDVVSIFRGDVNKRLFHKEFVFGSQTRSVSYSADQAGGVYAGVGDHVVVSHFELDAGLYFRATVYADLRAKYGWTKFELFSFIVGASAELDAWLELEITGGAAIEHSVYKKERTGTVFIVVIPIVYTLHGQFDIGIGIDISIGISAKLSFPETHIRFGVEYRDGSGWNTIEEMPNFELTKSFGAEMLDSDDCLRFVITPYIQVNFGVRLYASFDLWIQPRANFPTTLVWPATCNAMSACEQGTKQLGFQTTFDLDFMYGVTAQIEIDGHKIGPSWTAFRTEPLVDIVLFDQQCIPLPLPFIDQVCCPPTPSPTTVGSPTTSTTTTGTPTYAVAVADAESLQQCGSAWTEHTDHRGMRPDCPVTTGGVFGSHGYMLGNIANVKAACEQVPSCNVIMAYDWLIGSIDPSQDDSSYSYSCPDIANINWIAETNTWMVHSHLGEAVILDRFRWTEHTEHMGMRPDCPATVGGAYSDSTKPGFMWATAPLAQAACEAHDTCNVVMHYDVEIGSIEATQQDANYAYSCPDVNNINWILETNTWMWHYYYGEAIILERCGRREEQYAEGTLVPVDCTIRTNYFEGGSVSGVPASVTCEAGETLTSCGVDGWESVGGSWIDQSSPNTCKVLAHGLDRAYPKAVCCEFPAGAITATEVRASWSVNEQASLSCQFGQVMTGCQIMWQSGTVNNLAGTWTGALDKQGQEFNWKGMDYPYCIGGPKTSDTFVQVGAQCLNVADGYSMQCINRQMHTTKDGFGECPETHPLMTSCNTYTTDSNTLDSWFVNSGRCYVVQDNWAPMYANAICCRFASTGSPVTSPTDPTVAVASALSVSAITLAADSCITGDTLSVWDNLYIVFDLTMNTWNTGSFTHMFDIGDSSIFVRYYRDRPAQMYLGLGSQRFWADARTFASPADDDVTVHHEIYITQNSVMWTMDGVTVLDSIAAAHSLSTDQTLCFPKLTNGDSTTVDGAISNFAVLSSNGDTVSATVPQIALTADNCLADTLSVRDNLFIAFDLSVDSFDAATYLHMLDIWASDINSQYIFVRYSRGLGQMFLGIESQRFFASSRTFTAANNGQAVRHEILITQDAVKWTMDGVIVVDEVAVPHALRDDATVWFPKLTNGDSQYVSGSVVNFAVLSASDTAGGSAAQHVPEARDFGDRQVEPRSQPYVKPNEPQPKHSYPYELESEPHPFSQPKESQPQLGPQPNEPQPYSAPNEPQPQANQPQAQPQPQPRSYPDEPQAQPQQPQAQPQPQLQSQPQLRSYPNEPQAYSQPKSNPNEPQPDSQPLPNPVRNIPVDSPQAPPLDVTPYFNMNIALIALSALISIGNIIWSCKVCASKKTAAGFSKLNDDDDDDDDDDQEEERSSSP